MANQEQLDILRQGVETWNRWRGKHPDIRVDLEDAYLVDADLCGVNLSKAYLWKAVLREANLSGADLKMANLSKTDLIEANLSEAILVEADMMFADLRRAALHKANLSEANLTIADLTQAHLIEANLHKARLIDADLFQADLSGANLSEADLSRANLREARLIEADLRGACLLAANLIAANLRQAFLASIDLSWSDLTDADLSNANLVAANLTHARLVETKLEGANISDSHIYGISAWKLMLDGVIQSNLTITPSGEPTITVDNLEVAQFVYLLLNNLKIRDVIDTIAKKAVLILGRFTPERKAVLDALRNTLRSQGYLPILFDFDKPSSQDLTETVSTLAHLSRFIIVDLSDPSSAPYEVGTIASNHIRPIQAIFHPSDEAKRVFAMFPDLIMRYHWVLPPYEYQDQNQLLASLEEHVIEPAERKAKELAKLRAQEFEKQ